MSESWCNSQQQQQQNDVCYTPISSNTSQQQEQQRQLRRNDETLDGEADQTNYETSSQHSSHNLMKNNFIPNSNNSNNNNFPNYFYPPPPPTNIVDGGCSVGAASQSAAQNQDNTDVEKDLEFQDINNIYDTYSYNQLSKYDRYASWAENQHGFSHQPPPHFGHQRFWPLSKFGRRNIVTPKDSPIKVTLENKSLVERFDKYCTEMIITKTGRRMFPSPQVSIQGMEANLKYFILFDVTPADDNRYKFHHFNWVIAGKAEPLPPVRFYIHPESPLTGSQWMKQQITFQKVKLTNNTCDQHGHLILNSMHRYQPRIHVVQANDIYRLQFQPFHTYAFPECQFIAVTAYQNSQVTQLKIEHNPFAKGFRKQEKDKRDAKKVCEDTEDIIENKKNDLKRPHSLEAKTAIGEPDRKTGCYDIAGMPTWNFPDQMNQASMFGGKPVECCSTQSKYEPYRYSQILHSYEASQKTAQHYSSNYDHLRYNDTSHVMSEQIRLLPYMGGGEFSSTEYRANGPAFI